MTIAASRRSSLADPRAVTVIGGFAGLGLGVLIWHLVAATQPVLLATPAEALQAVRRLAASGELFRAIADSGRTFGTGLVIAILAGVPGGLVLARSRFMERSTLWLVFAIQAIPLVALAPLVSATIGFGFWAKVLIVFLSALFPIVLNTMEGAKSVPQPLLDVAAVYRSRELTTWKDVVLPYTLPNIMTGVRQGIATALIGTLVAEFFLSVSGVGAVLLAASARFDVATVIGVTITLAVGAVILIEIGKFLEWMAAPWRR